MLACALLVATAACGQGDLAPDEMTGIAEGDKAPDFTLQDQNGEEQSLSELVKTGTVALVFYRSANW